jgi:LCP family protein required for cell wall assembly
MSRTERKKSQLKKGKKRYLQIGILVLLSVICFGFLYLFNIFPFGSDILAYDRLNILAVGTDSVESVGRADTIFVLSLSPKTKDTILFSIPRDTRVMIPGRGMDKINHAFAYGDIELLEETIENLMGISIHYYGVVDFEGFQYIIDAIGGVKIDVEKDMYYVDQAGSLKINLHSGEQVLDGKKALDYARFRFDPLGDLGRIQRQQKLINAVIDKVMNFDIMVKLPNIISSLTEYIKTNMNPNEIISLARILKDIDRDKIWVETIKGEPQYIDRVSYLVVEQEQVEKRVKYLIDNKQRGLNVEVLNGARIPGIARSVASKMTELGFNIVNVDNADSFDYQKTVLIIYSKEITIDEYVKQYLGDIDIIRKEQPQSEVDMTIIIGKNMLY